MSRAESTVETWPSSLAERRLQEASKLRSAAASALISAGVSGVVSTAVYASICRSVRHSTGALRATPRGSTATMSYREVTAVG